MILVTGGAGFIGSHVVDALIAAGHQVTVVDNLATGNRENLNPKAKFFPVDIRSDEVADIFAETRPSVVCHLAAQMVVQYSVERPIEDADINIIGSLNILQNCVACGVDKIVFASSAGAIYGQPDHLPVSEDYVPQPACHYGVSKLAVEHYVRLYNALYGLQYTILRFANVFGPRQNPHGKAGLTAILTGMMLEGRRPILYGYGKPLREYVYVSDIARGVLLALSAGAGHVLNLGAGQAVSVLEIFRLLQDLLGYDDEPIMKPLRPGEIQQIYTSNARAGDVLGWKPEVGLREGLAELVAFLRAQKTAKTADPGKIRRALS